MKTIKKIVKCDSKMLNELIIGTKIKNMSYYFLYFKPIVSHKIITPIEWDDFFLQKEEHSASKTSINVSDEYDYDLLKQQMSDNLHLRIFIEKNSELQKMDDFYNFFVKLQEKPLKELFVNMVGSYKYLLKALLHLSKNNIVYLQLNNETILINHYKQPILHDFSYSFFNNFNDVAHDPIHIPEHLFQDYNPYYYFWPLEVHIICFLNTSSSINTLSRTNIEDICKQYIIKNEGLRNLPKEYIQNYYHSCVTWLISLFLVNQTREKITNEMIKYSKTWDNFSLSMLFLPMVTILLKKTNNNTFLEEFTKLLLENIHPNPEKRKNICDSSKHFESLFQEGINWLEIAKIKINDNANTSS